jgi:hypothetical protein
VWIVKRLVGVQTSDVVDEMRESCGLFRGSACLDADVEESLVFVERSPIIREDSDHVRIS